jgi:hypothetical protein
MTSITCFIPLLAARPSTNSFDLSAANWGNGQTERVGTFALLRRLYDVSYGLIERFIGPTPH